MSHSQKQYRSRYSFLSPAASFNAMAEPGEARARTHPCAPLLSLGVFLNVTQLAAQSYVPKLATYLGL